MVVPFLYFRRFWTMPAEHQQNGECKGRIKAHVLINGKEDVPSMVLLTKGSANDYFFLKPIQLPEKSVIAFDREYRS